MHYYHQLNQVQRRKFVRRVKIFLLVLSCALVILLILFIVDGRRAKQASDQPSTSSAQTTNYSASNVQIFRTSFFQFQANASWSQAVPESSDHKFLYRSLQGSIIEHELTIYVDQAPPLAVTHILPVTLDPSGQLTFTKTSDHCGSVMPPGQKIRRVITQDQVMFECFGDNTNYNLLVGLRGGTPQITLPRPAGGNAVYTIYYQNLTANPEPSQLEAIVSTFQAR